jgi:hypothetical protein
MHAFGLLPDADHSSHHRRVSLETFASDRNPAGTLFYFPASTLKSSASYFGSLA